MVAVGQAIVPQPPVYGVWVRKAGGETLFRRVIAWWVENRQEPLFLPEPADDPTFLVGFFAVSESYQREGYVFAGYIDGPHLPQGAANDINLQCVEHMRSLQEGPTPDVR